MEHEEKEREMWVSAMFDHQRPPKAMVLELRRLLKDGLVYLASQPPSIATMQYN